MISCWGGGGEDNTTQCFDTLTTFQNVCNKKGVPLAEEKNCSPSQNLDVFRNRIRHSCDGAETYMREIN